MKSREMGKESDRKLTREETQMQEPNSRGSKKKEKKRDWKKKKNL